MSPFVVCPRDCPEPLLTCRVPNLQFYHVPLNCDRPSYSSKLLEPEIHSDCREVGFLEGVVGEPAKKRRLAYRAVADQYYFEEVVVLPNHYFFGGKMLFKIYYNLPILSFAT
jgi:hypothetical protein